MIFANSRNCCGRIPIFFLNFIISHIDLQSVFRRRQVNFNMPEEAVWHHELFIHLRSFCCNKRGNRKGTESGSPFFRFCACFLHLLQYFFCKFVQILRNTLFQNAALGAGQDGHQLPLLFQKLPLKIPKYDAVPNLFRCGRRAYMRV